MKKEIKILAILCVGLLLVTGCGKKSNSATSAGSTATQSDSTGNISIGGALSIENIFTSRDLKQTVDTSDATTYTVSSGKDITITEEGVYVITGNAENVTIVVEVDSEEKVQLVLDGLTVKNSSAPCIYVKNADKVFLTTVNDNNLSVTDTFTADGDVNTDAVIFSKDDLVLNGTGSLTISSTDNGITSKDDLKITGGNITISCTSDALEANNGVAIYDGNIIINTKKDGIHAEYDEDNSKGYVYITGGTLNITATDDAIHATTVLQIDGGTITTNSAEGLEATYIQINDGTMTITASDDGMNAAQQSSSYTATIEINGGSITISMGQGDTDGIDSNGNLYIKGGTINITAQSPFDYDGECEYTGGTLIVNGEETTTITNQQMGGEPGGNQGGMQGNQGGHGRR